MTDYCHQPPSGGMRLNAALAADPSRTTMLKAAFIRDFNRRFRSLLKLIRISIIDNDAFGIDNQPATLAAIPKRAFQFDTAHSKAVKFMDWLYQQEDEGILQIIHRPGVADKPWTNKYIDSAYQRGIRNSDAWLKQVGTGGSITMQLPGSLPQAIQGPIHAGRIATIYTRTFEALKTVTDVMNVQVQEQIVKGLTEGLAQGLAEGKSPRVIARELYKNVEDRVDKIGKVRARMIARTEILNAHNVAVLSEYELAEQMIGKVVMVDVSLGANPCEICIDLEAGGPYTRLIADGQLPAHPNCVCVHIPVIVENK